MKFEDDTNLYISEYYIKRIQEYQDVLEKHKQSGMIKDYSVLEYNNKDNTISFNFVPYSTLEYMTLSEDIVTIIGDSFNEASN